ncbi:hypothetical protein F5B20DRAFT_550882 [Whalleya microplaca]|nr:hypothetical protein F5B20DRAFT_550882 [Whalleya microplaca]
MAWVMVSTVGVVSLGLLELLDLGLALAIMHRSMGDSTGFRPSDDHSWSNARSALCTICNIIEKPPGPWFVY